MRFWSLVFDPGISLYMGHKIVVYNWGVQQSEDFVLMSLKSSEKKIIDDILCGVEQFGVNFRGEELLLEGIVKLFSTFSILDITFL